MRLWEKRGKRGKRGKIKEGEKVRKRGKK